MGKARGEADDPQRHTGYVIGKRPHRSLQDGQRDAQEGPLIAQEGAKTALEAPKTAHEASTTAPINGKDGREEAGGP